MDIMYEHPNTQFHVPCREQTNSPAIFFINAQNDYKHMHKRQRETEGVGEKETARQNCSYKSSLNN